MCQKVARSQPGLNTRSACQERARPSRDLVNRYHPVPYHAAALKWTRHTRPRPLSTPPGAAADEATARCEKILNNPSHSGAHRCQPHKRRPHPCPFTRPLTTLSAPTTCQSCRDCIDVCQALAEYASGHPQKVEPGEVRLKEQVEGCLLFYLIILLPSPSRPPIPRQPLQRIPRKWHSRATSTWRCARGACV